jgi:hypothetical protein
MDNEQFEKLNELITSLELRLNSLNALQDYYQLTDEELENICGG